MINIQEVFTHLSKKGSDLIEGVSEIIKNKGGRTYSYSNPVEDFHSSQVANLLNAIAYNETRGVEGNKYDFRKPSGNEELGDDIGKYQVTAGELKSWSKEFLGEEVDPDTFHKNPKLQERYMRSKIQNLLEHGATPEEVLALHRGGLTGYADPEVRKRKREERKDYVDSALEFLKQKGSNNEDN